MRILILGAGALGGYFGARLLAAGRDVTFLVRPGSARLLAERGLQVRSAQRGDVFVPNPPAVQKRDIAAPYDLVLLSCKAYDLADAIDSIAPAVGPETTILPMLNGMAHVPVLDARFGRDHVLGGTCFISSVRDADGTIRHLNDRDGFFFGDRFAPGSPRMDAIAASMADANFDARLRPVILQDMWEKWSYLATLAGISCLMRTTLGDVVATGNAGLTLRFYAECTAIAAAEGYAPSAKFLEKQQALLTLPGSTMTASMLRDLEEGAPVESHQILEDLLDRGRAHRVSAPLLEIALAHVRCYEARRRRELAERRNLS
jgi:2-dehydropantoate 2-reductase